MLDKYTIFDNFDKLDLSPVANRFDERLDNSGTQKFLNVSIYGNDQITAAEKLDKINFVKANETIYFKLGDARYQQQPEPYNTTAKNFGSLGTYLPDMFRYITSQRFYIDNNLQIKYTKTGLSESGTTLYLRNLFDLDFYFQFAELSVLGQQIKNNNILYSKLGNNIQGQQFLGLSSFLGGGGIGGGIDVNFDGLLDKPSDGTINPFQGGLNKVIFGYDSSINKLTTKDAVPYASAPKQMNYLAFEAEKSEQYLNSLIILLQRLLYPIATNPNGLPRHIYFVTDLNRSVNTESVADVLPYSDFDFVKVGSSYNFYKRYAEDFPSNVSTEWQLPNAYTYYSFLNSKKQNKLSKYYSDLIKVTPFGLNPESLNGVLDEEITFEKYYGFSNASSDPGQFQSANLTGEAAENFLNVYRNRNISFGNNVEKITKDVDAIKKIFPYYNKVELPRINSDLVNKLQQQNFLDAFMSLICNYFGDRAVDVLGKPAANGIDYRKGPLHTFSGFSSDDGDGSGTNIFASTMQVLDVTSMSTQLSKYKNYLFDNSLVKFASNSVMIPEKQEDSILSDYNISALYDVIRDYSKNKILPYAGIKNGHKCYSEMLGFEIVKSSNANGQKTILQSFFIPCVGDSPLSYIDTQVFYGKDYTYEVYSISLVVGTEYHSELGRVNEANAQLGPEFSSTEKALSLQNVADDGTGFPSPSFVLPEQDQPMGGTDKPIIVRAPYYNNVSFGTQKTTKLMDKPPLPPEMTFYPYKDIDDKVLILLNVNYGERKLFPVQVFPEDIEQIAKYYESQADLEIDKVSLKRRVLYRTDDFLGTYKIYRTDRMPTSWTDFVNQPIAQISNQQSSGFESTLSPNIDYYYFARFEDIHGNFSNPTAIYKLRIVKEGGFPPYMLLKVYSFSEARKGLVREKTFKKYLKIRLADDARLYTSRDDISKTNISYRKTFFNTDINRLFQVGPLRKYKIRITSKQTGKKIDINLDFKKNISERYLSKQIETEKQSLGMDLIDKDNKKIESKSNFINTDDAASQYNEKAKVITSDDLQTDMTISFIDKQN